MGGPQRRPAGKPVTYRFMHKVSIEAARRAGIKKPADPYNFRRSGLTLLSKDPAIPVLDLRAHRRLGARLAGPPSLHSHREPRRPGGAEHAVWDFSGSAAGDIHSPDPEALWKVPDGESRRRTLLPAVRGSPR